MTALIYPIERVRRMPRQLSERIAGVLVRSKVRALVSMALLFYALPGLGPLIFRR